MVVAYTAMDSGDDTVALNAILATSQHVVLPPGNYHATTLNIVNDGTVLEFLGGAVLNLTNAAITGINVTGANVTIMGPGAIKSPASWNGANSRRTYATIWVAADGFTMTDVTLDYIPRAGVHFEDCTNHRIQDCRLIGKYPQADYNPAATTGQMAIDYNPPASGGPRTDTGNGSLIVSNCRIESCIQGVFFGNYDGGASEVGVTITGNSFNRCWDHGIYCTLGEGQTITGNNFTNCKFPIVTDGKAATVVGNSLYATEDEASNGQQVISVRNASDSVIADNTLHGLGAGIYVDVVNTVTPILRNRISGNVIRRTGAGVTESAIRLGLAAIQCEDNVIENNLITGGHYGHSVGVIQLEMASSRGLRNRVTGNKIERGGALGEIQSVNPIINALWQNYLTVEGNETICAITNTQANVVAHVYLTDCDYFTCNNNRMRHVSGVNVQARGVQVVGSSAGGEVNWNSFDLASALSAFAIDYVGPNATVSSNHVSPAAKLYGSITVASGSASGAASNANAVAAFSRVRITPTNDAAGALVASPGVKAVVTAGTVTISTATGANAPAAATFGYELT